MTTALAPESRRPAALKWRQFSLRSLLVLVLLCCIGLGLWTTCVEPYRRQHRLAAEIVEAGGSVRTETVAAIGSAVFGKDFFMHIVEIDSRSMKVDDAWMAQLRQAPRLQVLYLHNAGIGDQGLAHVSRLKHLRTLDVGGTRITNAGLSLLKSCTELEGLVLSRTSITDEGLAALSGLSRLVALELENCSITNAGLRQLAAPSDALALGDRGPQRRSPVRRLDALNLSGTQITDEGFEALLGFPKLGYLQLDQTDISQACLPVLQQLSELREVSTVGTSILPSALREALPGIQANRWAHLLAEPTVLHFVDTPLQDVADYLRDYHKIEIFLDVHSLRAAGFKDHQPVVTINFKGSLQEGLQEMLEPKRMKCVVRHGILMLTTTDQPATLPPRLIQSPEEKLSRTFSTLLYKTTPIEFVQAPFSDVAAYLSDLRIPVSLEEGRPHVSAQRFVNHNSRLPAADSLEILFHELDLHGVIRNNTIHVFEGPVPEIPRSVARP